MVFERIVGARGEMGESARDGVSKAYSEGDAVVGHRHQRCALLRRLTQNEVLGYVDEGASLLWSAVSCEELTGAVSSGSPGPMGHAT